ncbi:MAG TPA: hypothetical protein VGP88_09055 [Thermoplasmata archaeon]|nr:hypothetical protein [Thermoplasmata archaeon]
MAQPTESPAPPDPFEGSGIDDRPVAFGFLLGYLDLAFRGAQEYETYRELVLGPWLEVHRRRGGFGLRQWRRTVDERARFAPLEHLGAIRVRMDFRDEPGFLRRRPAVEPVDPTRQVELRVGTPMVQLVVEADDEGRAVRLLGLAREVAERFRRQLD